MRVEYDAVRARKEPGPRGDVPEPVVQTDVWPIAGAVARDVADEIVDVKVASEALVQDSYWAEGLTKR